MTSLLGGAFLLTVTTTTAIGAPAMPGTPWKQAEVFSICSGRLAALAARQQANDDPQSTRTLRQRDMFDLMLEATLPDAVSYGVPEDEPLRWRSSGWSETAILLSNISYSFDAGRVERAQAALEQRIADCTGLLLGD
ncbi:hypothetical protein RGUI_1872 [Rhodovulum sp. P5]|uniref:hypothetical protein n=1 Tax=Rhodovulum sp. P5 TaxID=1564506 RepID=UPI0009C267F4|nr:hypothetical protein [Rhodovulum sp. P5]ARE40013.1 hypothetical protein RGUI_1872 [Rhodovulum sp. P5]